MLLRLLAIEKNTIKTNNYSNSRRSECIRHRKGGSLAERQGLPVSALTRGMVAAGNHRLSTATFPIGGSISISTFASRGLRAMSARRVSAIGQPARQPYRRVRDILYAMNHGGVQPVLAHADDALHARRIAPSVFHPQGQRQFKRDRVQCARPNRFKSLPFVEWAYAEVNPAASTRRAIDRSRGAG
jgi:hypothetical protein